jgi:Na+-translocating ferredoxin:NAD+ oxidoreductase RnfA subunit
MILVAGDIVDWDALIKVVYQALAAGLGFTLAFSLAVAGSTRFADEVRQNRMTRAVLYGALGVLALLVCVAAVVLGIVVMTQKG